MVAVQQAPDRPSARRAAPADWWRRWALLVAGAYAALLVAIVAGLSSEPAKAALVVAPLLVADVAFAWGLVKFDAERSRRLRIAGWVVVLLGAVPLISFAFVVAPLVLSTAPAAFARASAPRERAGRTLTSTALQVAAVGFAILGLALIAAVVIPGLGDGEETDTVTRTPAP